MFGTNGLGNADYAVEVSYDFKKKTMKLLEILFRLIITDSDNVTVVWSWSWTRGKWSTRVSNLIIYPTKKSHLKSVVRFAFRGDESHIQVEM